MLVALLTSLVANVVMAQRDTTVVFTRNGHEARFNFQIIDTHPGTTRLASSAEEWHRIMNIVSGFIQLEKAYDSLALIKSAGDSLFVVQSKYYQTVVSNFNARIQNYANTHMELASTNQELNKLLSDCNDLASRQHRRSAWKSLAVGGFSTIFGIVLGVLLSH